MVDKIQQPDSLATLNLPEDVAKRYSEVSQDLAIARRKLARRVSDYLDDRMMYFGTVHPSEYRLFDAAMEYIQHVGSQGIKSGLSSNGSSLPLAQDHPERVFADIVLALNIDQDVVDLPISRLETAAKRLVRAAEVQDAILEEATERDAD